MELNAKPTETNMVLVHDKILMALLAAKGIMADHIFMTGWPDEPPEYKREAYMSYKRTAEVKQLIEAFEKREVNVNLDDYLSSMWELELYFDGIVYSPKETEGTENE